MGGIAILLIVTGYLALAVWLLVKAPWRWKPALLLAAVLIPSADSLWAHYVTMPRVCKDAGLKIYRKADKSEGLRFEGAADDSFVKKYGFAFVEGKDATGRYYRFGRAGDQIVYEQKVQPKARYLSDSQSLFPARGVGGTKYRVLDLTTGEVIGELVDFGYGGGWAERFLASFTDSGPGPFFVKSCNVGPFIPTRLLRLQFDLGE
jgi:hypothetical protein